MPENSSSLQSKTHNSSFNPRGGQSLVSNRCGHNWSAKETPCGNKYIITCTDAFSKWPEAENLPSKSALHVSQFLLKCFCRHGCTEIEITDQGREFCNSVSDRPFELCGTEQRVTSTYHPQSNGQTERFHQVLLTLSRKC